MIVVIHALCALTALACAVLLLQAARRSRSRMLVCSGICFALLAVSNTLLILDSYAAGVLTVWPVRHSISLLAVSVLLYGLVLEER